MIETRAFRNKNVILTNVVEPDTDGIQVGKKVTSNQLWKYISVK